MLDVGWPVLGTYLLSRNVITLSIAPKDAHENQIQFALERDLPAMVVALVTRRLLYLSQAFDLIHCSRCRINWTCDDGILLLDVNRMLRVGGYFAWAVQSVYKHEENLEMQWKEMVNLTTRLCWQQPYEEAMGDLENVRLLDSFWNHKEDWHLHWRRALTKHASRKENWQHRISSRKTPTSGFSPFECFQSSQILILSRLISITRQSDPLIPIHHDLKGWIRYTPNQISNFYRQIHRHRSLPYTTVTTSKLECQMEDWIHENLIMLGLA